jgi:hypothetical protein
MKIKRTWVSAISERISTVGNTGQTIAVQQTVHGNWYGYIGGKRVQMFIGYDNNEDGAMRWLAERANAKQ